MKKALFLSWMFQIGFNLLAQTPHTLQELQVLYSDGQKAQVEGRYSDAIAIFLNLVKICEADNKPIALSGVLNELGGCYMLSGEFDKALETFNRSIQLKKENRQLADLLPSLNNLANLFYTFGNNDKALEYFQMGTEILPEVTDNKSKGEFLFNLGYFHYSIKNYDEATKIISQSMPLLVASKSNDYLASASYTMAELCFRIKDYDQATTYLDQAMASQRKQKRFDDLSKSFNLAALIAEAKGDIMKATISFQLSADIVPQGKESKGTTTALYNLGRLYMNQKDYAQAETALLKAIDITEKLRTGATGSIRRDFMEQQIYTYQYLTTIYLRNNQPEKAFNNVEIMSGKYLVDQLGEKMKAQSVEYADIAKYRLQMDTKTAVLCFSNVSLSAISSDYIGIASFCAHKNGLAAQEIDSRNFSKTIMASSGKNIETTLEQLRGFIPAQTFEGAKPSGDNTVNDFEKIINIYRQLLSKQALSAPEHKLLDDISKGLYNLLITPIEKQLVGKTELLVIPGDILAFIPFETLKNKDGKYLIESFNITYTQSLTVSEMLLKRKFDTARKPILAIGNPVYLQSENNAEHRGFKNLSSDDEFQNLRMQSLKLIEKQPKKVGELYPKFGIFSWANLAGTAKELESIRQTFSDATVISGIDANETLVKEMSEKGELRKYRQIHFATHGLAMPQLPDLSALVLTLTDTAKSTDDGYLRMNEIAALDLQCDFVNLSACETGLGKIYGGEGVVGLTQSFLVAGANSLSVSLWQVADASTMEFMSGVYALVRDQKLSYAKAMREMKLKFLKGQYKTPFYWAPFVFYGI